MARLRQWDEELYGGRLTKHLSDDQLREWLMERYPHLARSAEPPWKFIHSQVTGVQDVLYPHDPAVIRAIHSEFDPRVVPLFVRRTYRSKSGGTRTFGFHCLGSYLWNPTMKPDRWTERVMKPAHGQAFRVTQMDMHFEDRTKKVPGLGLPGAYLPFNWGVYAELRGRYQNWTAKQRVRYISENDEAARARKRREAADRRTADIIKADGPMLKRRFDNIDKHDLARLADAAVHPKVTPMVHVRRVS